jgi:hypothetical protein
MINDIKSDLGECVCVLFHKAWGKTLYKGKLKNQSWWQRRKEELIHAPSVIIQNPQDGNIGGFILIPFEIEVGHPELTYEELIVAWQKAFPDRKC